MNYIGDLTIDTPSDATLPALTMVGGYMRIDASATLPALTTVGGYLHINASIALPALAGHNTPSTPRAANNAQPYQHTASTSGQPAPHDVYAYNQWLNYSGLHAQGTIPE